MRVSMCACVCVRVVLSSGMMTCLCAVTMSTLLVWFPSEAGAQLLSWFWTQHLASPGQSVI